MDNNFSVFGLTVEQTEVLFALQRRLIQADVKCESTKKPIFGNNKTKEKQTWLNLWDKSIQLYLEKLGKERRNVAISTDDLRRIITEIDKQTQNKVWKHMVFLECVLFHLYYPLDTNKDAHKPFKGLRIDKQTRKEVMKNTRFLMVPVHYIASRQYLFTAVHDVYSLF